MTKVIARHDVDPGVLEDRLYEFNAAATGKDDGRTLGFVVEEDGEVIAACAGHTWAGIAEVKQMWVAEAHRGRDLGASLMRAAIGEAIARRCKFMFVATHSFQAPDFYKRLGFETVAVIPDKPLGHAEHILRRKL
jgi:N-acetylglutamate synthase-like GNAT family acetyltransferase